MATDSQSHLSRARANKPQRNPALRDHSAAEADVAEAEESKSLVPNSL